MNRKIRTLIAAGLTNVALAALATPAYAALTNPIGYNSLDDLISDVLGYLFAAAGLIAITFLVVGGIQYMMSGGDKMGVQAAQGKITGALVGLVIAVCSFLIVDLVICKGILKMTGGCVTLPF